MTLSQRLNDGFKGPIRQGFLTAPDNIVSICLRVGLMDVSIWKQANPWQF